MNPEKERLRFFYKQKGICKDKALVEGLCRLNFSQFLPLFSAGAKGGPSRNSRRMRRRAAPDKNKSAGRKTLSPSALKNPDLSGALGAAPSSFAGGAEENQTAAFSFGEGSPVKAGPAPFFKASGGGPPEPPLFTAGFHPLKGEPSLWPFYEDKAKGLTVFPVVEEEGPEGPEGPGGAFKMVFYKPDKAPEGCNPESRSPEGPNPESRGPEGCSPESRGPEGCSPESFNPESRSPKESQGEDKNRKNKGESAWRRSRLGFLEPNPKRAVKVSSSRIFLCLVPGLAFDRKGRRLGRGGGFYDRFLSQSPALRVGVADSARLHKEDLPEEAHDIRMDIVVTEKFILVPDITRFYGG